MRLSSGRRGAIAALAAALLLEPVTIGAQQSSSAAQPATAASQATGAGKAVGTGTATTATGRRPASARASTTVRDDGARPQGFSVVLVVADLRAMPGEDDVPPAARKALLDMKDFLPYKSYRLLDASWILCCGNGRTINRMRGPEEQEYELELATQGADESRLNVQFSLRDVQGAPPAPLSKRPTDSGAQTSIEALEKQLADARQRLAAARQKQTANHPEVVRIEAEMHALQNQLAEVRARRDDGDVRTPIARPGVPRPLINTSFTMSLGETVVVGTSRLSGNSKALIALLTAVPPRTH